MNHLKLEEEKRIKDKIKKYKKSSPAKKRKWGNQRQND